MKNRRKIVKNQFIYCAAFMFVTIFSQTAMAEQAEYQFGGGLMKFDYAEYNDSNVFIDGEKGYLPGIVLKRKQKFKHLYTELVGQLYGNMVKYDGQTTDGVPAKTKSIAVILDTHFKLGLTLAKHEPYIGLGYRYWYREILSGQDINGDPFSGLVEEYYWYYGMVGYRASFSVSENISMGFDLRHTKMLNGKMDLELSGFDSAQVNLGNESGVRFAFPIGIKVKTHTLIVAPYYEIIDIGKSNSVRLTQAGIPTSTVIFEPRSETRNLGVEITWLW